MTTFGAIITRVGEISSGLFFQTGTAESGTRLSLVDASRLGNTFRGSIYEGWWVRFPSRVGSNRERQIDRDTSGTGTISWSTPLDTAVVPAETYELHRYRPSTIEWAINRALDHMEFTERIEFSGVDGQTSYSIADIIAPGTWFIHEQQFLGLNVRTGNATNQYRYRPATEPVYIRRDQDTFTLQIPNGSYGSNDTLEFVASRPYSSLGVLSNESDTITCPLEWIAWEAYYELISAMMRTLAGTERQQAIQDAQEAWVRVQAMRNQYSPRRPHRLFRLREGETWGPDGRFY